MQRGKAAGNLKLANDTITDMQARQRDVVAAKCWLQLNTICAKQSISGGVGLNDAVSSRLTDAAQRDYFTLREQIEVAVKPIGGLQQYIRSQCEKMTLVGYNYQ
ncbi:lysis system i-spanin subunit Rz [Pantoea sp. UBA4549]|uniref:lysis system i-spanin subunit Rz n=1 Tax=Pantoea sp. UBA4549 TaxID=1947033 RepID=UPI0032E4E6D4